MTDAVFVRKVREEQLKIFASDWQLDPSETEAIAQSLLDNAQRCVLAVQKAIDGIQKSARTPNNPPVALRAYFFGRHVDSEAIANLDAMLRLEASAEPSRDQTPLSNDFDAPI